ncbi:hypothetical protein EYF80_067688 [Liparis tanakae]|uniref:Uncharacterized protein n=1 Tax=Liparis tanakae TaxID=230148 RepID=A0A4Z2E0F5_9TELE|nr:hypothetical protein EYF80_067688 [Liparis tanakae]
MSLLLKHYVSLSGQAPPSGPVAPHHRSALRRRSPCVSLVSPSFCLGAVSEPRLSVVPGVPVTVQCDAGCWSPLPVVTIEDARGNAVAGAQESKHVEDSVSGCVSVTRRATVKTDRFGYT